MTFNSFQRFEINKVVPDGSHSEALAVSFVLLVALLNAFRVCVSTYRISNKYLAKPASRNEVACLHRNAFLVNRPEGITMIADFVSKSFALTRGHVRSGRRLFFDYHLNPRIAQRRVHEYSTTAPNGSRANRSMGNSQLIFRPKM